MARTHVLALDLGTSRIKAAVVDESLRVLTSASASHPTISSEAGMAEQRSEDWLAGIRASVAGALGNVASTITIDAVVLTAQIPTLVAVSAAGRPLGNAVTWQDSRADDLVASLLSPAQRRRLYEISGAPIDGRYVIPMHLRRLAREGYSPAAILSAKDYLFLALTGELVTDPSTASGFGNFDLATGDWSDHLTSQWGVSKGLLPRVEDPGYHVALSASGAELLGGVAAGTPVFVGAADSVCAHHFVDAHFDRPISVIDGSSTVILATLSSTRALAREILITPLVDPSRRGVELDLLATGSSIAWLANLLDVHPGEVERLALSHANPTRSDAVFYPYLAGGEQGALWRNDVSGMITHVSLATTREDLALALFEGIAFETVRCIRLLEDIDHFDAVVSLAGSTSGLLGAAIVGAVVDLPVVAFRQHSPSLLGAALIGVDALGALDTPLQPLTPDAVPVLAGDYDGSLADKLSAYLAGAPATMDPLHLEAGS